MPERDEPAEVPDPRLIEAHDLALAALREITPERTIGAPAGYLVEDGGAVSLRFENALPGYPGWHWTVSLAVVEGSEPTVLEVELLPGDGALLAPEWVPWSVRLEEYKAAQAVAEAAQPDAEGDADEDADDEDVVEADASDDFDEDDFDEDGSPILHAGDVDGVDIDELDAEQAGDDAEDDEDAEWRGSDN